MENDRQSTYFVREIDPNCLIIDKQLTLHIAPVAKHANQKSRSKSTLAESNDMNEILKSNIDIVTCLSDSLIKEISKHIDAKSVELQACQLTAWLQRMREPNNLKPLGSGYFGSVHLGRLKHYRNSVNYEYVAVKIPHTTIRNSNEELSKEICIMSRIGYHENVLALIGSINNNKQIYLVTEFCSLGSLDKYLNSAEHQFVNEIDEYCLKTSQTIYKAKLNESWTFVYKERRGEGIVTTSDLLCFAYQTTNGMKFLRSREVTHRDLALRNVLLTSKYIVKIGDFGLSRRTYRGFYLRHDANLPLPIKSTPPKDLFDQCIPIESDLYAFGILLWELFTLGGSPYERFDTMNNASDEVINFIVHEGKILERPPFAPVEMYNLMKSLWNLEPIFRPKLETCKKYIMNQLKAACLPMSAEFDETDERVVVEERDGNVQNHRGQEETKENNASTKNDYVLLQSHFDNITDELMNGDAFEARETSEMVQSKKLLQKEKKSPLQAQSKSENFTQTSAAPLKLGPSPSPAHEVVKATGPILIKTHHGTYIRAHPGRFARVDQSDILGSWEKFIIIEYTNGKVAFRTFDGNYLRADDRGEMSTQLFADTCEKFEKLNANGKWAFKSYDGKYMTAEEGSEALIRVNQKKIDECERFEFVYNF